MDFGNYLPILNEKYIPNILDTAKNIPEKAINLNLLLIISYFLYLLKKLLNRNNIIKKKI